MVTVAVEAVVVFVVVTPIVGVIVALSVEGVEPVSVGVLVFVAGVAVEGIAGVVGIGGGINPNGGGRELGGGVVGSSSEENAVGDKFDS